jgi:hypothetical protein
MKDFRTIIRLWPTLAQFAADIGVTERHANVMRFRNSVPPNYWPDVIAGAERRKLKVSYADLAKLRRPKKSAARREAEVRPAA